MNDQYIFYFKIFKRITKNNYVCMCIRTHLQYEFIRSFIFKILFNKFYVAIDEVQCTFCRYFKRLCSVAAHICTYIVHKDDFLLYFIIKRTIKMYRYTAVAAAATDVHFEQIAWMCTFTML